MASSFTGQLATRGNRLPADEDVLDSDGLGARVLVGRAVCNLFGIYENYIGGTSHGEPPPIQQPKPLCRMPRQMSGGVSPTVIPALA